MTLPTALLRIILARGDFTPLTAGLLLAAAAPKGWGRDATFLYKRADGREVDSGDPAIVGGMPWSEQRSNIHAGHELAPSVGFQWSDLCIDIMYALTDGRSTEAR